jgi:hypothetical protein
VVKQHEEQTKGHGATAAMFRKQAPRKDTLEALKVQDVLPP